MTCTNSHSKMSLRTFVPKSPILLPKSHFCHHYLLMELVGGLVVFAMILSFAFSMHRMIRRMEQRSVAESAALLVIGNAVERLSAESVVTREKAEMVLGQEFRASAAMLPKGMQPLVKAGPEGLHLSVQRDGRPARASIVLAWTGSNKGGGAR